MSVHTYTAAAVHAQFKAKWTKLTTVAGQLERSAQIPLPALEAVGREVQTTLDQCGCLASKSSKLEDEREAVADLAIGYDLTMAQKQPKLTVEWFVHRMSATHTPAAAASKKRAMQELKDQRALGGKDSYRSMSAWQQTVPTSPAGPPGFQPGHYTSPTRGRGAGRGRARGGLGDAGRKRNDGGYGGLMCAICTNVDKVANLFFTACPLTTSHKCGQSGHIQRHCPNSNQQQTAAAITERNEGLG